MQRRIILNTASGAARNEHGWHLGRVKRLPDGWLQWDHHGHKVEANNWQAMSFELSVIYLASVDLEK